MSDSKLQWQPNQDQNGIYASNDKGLWSIRGKYYARKKISGFAYSIFLNGKEIETSPRSGIIEAMIQAQKDSDKRP